MHQGAWTQATNIKVMKMDFEDIIGNAYEESLKDRRFGDKKEELKVIQNYIKSAKNIVTPTENEGKINAINKVLESFGLPNAKKVDIKTNAADLTRLPSISKAFMALDLCKCDLIIARGRLGVPGSGSLLVLMDKKGRILSAATSPSHTIHKKKVEDAVREEMTYALERIGFSVIE
jgi:hypothetical protein